MVTLLACVPQIKTKQVNLSGTKTHFVVAVGHQDTACSMAFPHWESLSLTWEVNGGGSQDRTPVSGADRQEALRVQDQQLLCSTDIY